MTIQIIMLIIAIILIAVPLVIISFSNYKLNSLAVIVSLTCSGTGAILFATVIHTLRV